MNLTITPKTINVAAQAKSKVENAVDPALTFLASGLVGSDALTGSLTRAAGEAVGTYAITQGTLDAGTNYTISFTSSTLQILPATGVSAVDDLLEIPSNAASLTSHTILRSALTANDFPTNAPILSVAPTGTNNYTVRLSGSFVIVQRAGGIVAGDVLTYTIANGTNRATAKLSFLNNGQLAGASVAKVLATGTDGSGNPQFTFAGMPGVKYAVERTTDMTVAASWAKITELTADVNGRMIYVETTPTPASATFYYRLYRAP